jgi:hypothetical protein
MAYGRTFRDAGAPGSLKWALREPAGCLTPAVLEALPRPDTALGRPCPEVRSLHRRWKDADLYFFFNEGEEALSVRAELEGRGMARRWDADSGGIGEPQGAEAGEGRLAVPLELGPHGTEFIVITG